MVNFERMIYVFVLLICFTPCTLGSKDTASIKERIPEIIDAFCPGVNVCRENRSPNASSVAFRNVFWSCCTECHCGMNCMENNTCCFPPKQPTITKEKRWQIGKKCLFPTSAKQSDSDPILRKSYYMVTSVADTMQTSQEMRSKIKCGDEIVAPWGSMFPLYSSTNKAIYKNKICAEAHGVKDGILWDAVLDCRIEITATGASVSIVNIESGVFPEGCSVRFIPPTKLRPSKAFQCFESLIDTCPQGKFHVPSETGLSEVDIIKMCESDFLSPFMKLYANVFCYICNENLPLEWFCNDTSETDRGSHASGFFGLINITLLKLGERKIIHNKKQPMMCESVAAYYCRPVLCRSLQIRDKGGDCQYFNKLWYNQEYVININLKLENNIDLHEMTDITRILSGMTMSIRKLWTIESIAYEVTGRVKNESSLVVKMRYKSSKVRPHFLMSTIQKIFKFEWKLRHGNDTLYLKSSFSKVLDINKYNIDYTEYFNVSDLSLIPMYDEVYVNDMYTGNTHIISKLYFCNQVELNSSEFSVNIDETYIFVEKTKKYLFDAEFFLLTKTDDRGKAARICVEDAGMFLIGNESWRNTEVDRMLYLISFLLIITEF